MIDSETIQFIKKEIEKQVNVILSGVAGNGTPQTEDVQQMFPSMPTIAERPVMHPFGISSAAPDGTISVVGRQGEHFGNRIVLGHRDKNKPVVQAGESMIYNAFGDQIYIKQGNIIATTPKWLIESNNIKFGSSAASENFVLGQVFKKFASDVLDLIIAHQHVSSAPGVLTGPPNNVANFTAQKLSPITDEKILSSKILGEK